MRYPIKKKLYLAFGAVIALVFALGGLTTWQLRAIARFDTEARRYQTVELEVKDVAQTMIQLRRHEKDFFARNGDEKYERQIVQRHKEYDEQVKQLKSHFEEEDGDLSHNLKVVGNEFAQYADAIGRAINHYKERGTATSGDQLQVRLGAHRMEEMSSTIGSDELEIEVLQARRSEKDFLLRGDQEYVDKVRGHAAAIRLFADRKLKGESAEHLRSAADDYENRFLALVEANRKLLSDQAELHTVTEEMEKSLTTLGQHAGVEAEQRAGLAAQARTTAQNVLFSFFALVVALSVFVARFFARQMEISLGELTEATRAFAGGDLTRRVQLRTSDEVAVLGKAFNDMAESSQGMRRNIEEAVLGINQVVGELQAAVSEQAASMQQQAASVSETVATVDEISHSANRVAEVAGDVMKGSNRSQEVATDGRSAVDDSVSGMHDVREQVENIAKTILELSEKTHRIGGIITTVEDFASQSSMLALNASIEAARGGQEGKAFSVVAAEVRKLAEQSRQATDEVRGILNEIQQATHTAVMVTEEGSKRVERGVDLVGKAGSIIGQLAESLGHSADSAKQIAAASRQQSTGMGQITSAMSGIESFSRQNLEAMRQTEETSRSLAAVSQQLKAALAQAAA